MKRYSRTARPIQRSSKQKPTKSGSACTEKTSRPRPGPETQGIIAVYRDADPRTNMNHEQIVVAIRRLESLRVTIVGDFHVLNHWR